jgi:hypothetical protein
MQTEKLLAALAHISTSPSSCGQAPQASPPSQPLAGPRLQATEPSGSRFRVPDRVHSPMRQPPRHLEGLTKSEPLAAPQFSELTATPPLSERAGDGGGFWTVPQAADPAGVRDVQPLHSAPVSSALAAMAPLDVAALDRPEMLGLAIAAAGLETQTERGAWQGPAVGRAVEAGAGPGTAEGFGAFPGPLPQLGVGCGAQDVGTGVLREPDPTLAWLSGMQLPPDRGVSDFSGLLSELLASVRSQGLQPLPQADGLAVRLGVS